MTRTYGSRYSELSGYQPAAAIAKLMRRDIKEAIAEGKLPGTTADYSVKVENYSMGRSINVEARYAPGLWEQCDGTRPDNVAACGRYEHQEGKTHERLSAEGRKVKAALQAIHNAYNHDGSDPMTDYFDVNYYGHAEVEDESNAKFRNEEATHKVARRQAIDTATGPKRRIVIYGRRGPSAVHDAVEVGGRLRLVCGAQLWRSSLTAQSSAPLTCSRCKKREKETS